MTSIVRLVSTFVFVVASAARALADVSCANPDDLCTGDPCTMTNIDVQSPCTVDFGSRTLIIAGILRVPDAGTLSLTADRIVQQGPIDGRHVGNGSGNGAAVTLIADAGDVELRGEIDVAGTGSTGSINVQAPAGNILVKDNLIAKPAGSNITAIGGNISLSASGTITTDQTAVIDAQGVDGATTGGVVFVAADQGVTIKGRVHAEGSPGGSAIVASSAGSVVLEGDLRVFSASGPGGLAIVSGETGIVLDDAIRASSELSVGGTVQLTSASGDIVLDASIHARGAVGGSISISAPLGTVAPTVKLDASSTTGNGGTIGIDADTISVRRDLEVRSRSASAGSITLTATTLLDMIGGDAEAGGKIDGGSITLQGGTINVRKSSSLTASGSHGDGGMLIVSAPGAAVTLEAKVALSGNGPVGSGGFTQVDANALTVSHVRFDADGRLAGGELHFNQSGAGLLTLDGTFEARDDGTIEAHAPAGSLTASGKFRARPTGCVGLSAGGTLNTAGASLDVPLTATCP